MMLSGCLYRSFCHAVVMGEDVVELGVRTRQKGVHQMVGSLLGPVCHQMAHDIHIGMKGCLMVETFLAGLCRRRRLQSANLKNSSASAYLRGEELCDVASHLLVFGTDICGVFGG